MTPVTPDPDQYRAALWTEIGSLKTGLASLAAAQAEMATDLKSLLASRSFTRGVWKTVVVVAGAVSTAVGLAIAWIKG